MGSDTTRFALRSSLSAVDDAGGRLDSGGAPAGDNRCVRAVSRGVWPLRPGQADRKEENQQLLRVPHRVDVTVGLRLFQCGDGALGWTLLVDFRNVQRKALQPGPGDHPDRKST